MDAASVTLSVEKTASDGEAIQIKLGSPLGELNVYASPTDRAALDSIRDARWSSRRSIRLGTVFGVPAWWSVDGDELTVLVGHDDETWDVAFTLPSTLLDDLKVQWAAA